jgi:hypothetical protein
MKSLATALMLTLSSTAGAADLYADFEIFAATPNPNAKFLVADFTSLSLDVTYTGRFMAVNGAFHSKQSNRYTPVTGTCAIESNGWINCDMQMNLSPYSAIVDVTIIRSSSGALTGLVTLTSASGLDIPLLESASLRATSIKAAR